MPLAYKTYPTDSPSASELRSILGQNLRRLTSREVSISALCRALGVNRTQFNRYLSGESFPRPDVLHRICTYFDVDARILLEPIEAQEQPAFGVFGHPELAEFTGAADHAIPQELFPDGIYRFSRPSFLYTEKYVKGIVQVYRRDSYTFIRGYELRGAMREQALPESPHNREFRGAVMARDSGVAALISRRGALTSTFNYLARVPSFENNFWVGYATRTAGETLTGRRVARVVYEHMNGKRREILREARAASFCDEGDLIPYHRQLLMAGTPFR